MAHDQFPYPRVAALGLLALCAATVALPAAAANKAQHYRGTISTVTDSGFTMTTRSGETQQIRMSSKTGLAGVTKGDLSNIEKGTFIGTANVEKNGENQALEMVIFPPAMKGTGLGDYGWDLTPEMVRASQQGADASNSGEMKMSSDSSMTNGTVSSKSGGSMSTGDSSMTNGTVESSSGGSGLSMSSGSSMTNGTVTQSDNASGSITLNVDYGKGSKKIVVPADTPTVKLRKGSKDDLKKGAHVFVAGTPSDDAVNAQLIAVGVNGVVPPM